MKLQLMLEDLIDEKYKHYGNVDEEDLENYIQKHEDQIINDYKAIDKDKSTYNHVEIRREILKENLIVDDENSEDYEVIYLDVNLESIAEMLAQITIEDLEARLGPYGGWQIQQKDGVYMLVDFHQ